MKAELAILLCAAIARSSLGQDVPKNASSGAVIQISSTQVDHSTLSCHGSGEKRATITVQIWIAASASNTTESQAMTVGLYEAWSLPPRSRLRLKEMRKHVAIKQSPAVVEYKLECDEKTTKAGDIAFTAFIDGATPGITIKLPDPTENGTVKIHVD